MFQILDRIINMFHDVLYLYSVHKVLYVLDDTHIFSFMLVTVIVIMKRQTHDESFFCIGG